MGDFQVEIESIRSAASWMESNAIATAGKLQSTLDFLNKYAATSDWSQVPSCIAFGASYNSAIEAYKSVADDLLSDAGKMRDALNKIADDYEHADESSRAGFEARLAALGTDPFMKQSVANTTYDEHKKDLHSDDPEAAPTQGAEGDPTPTPSAPRSTATGSTRIN